MRTNWPKIPFRPQIRPILRTRRFPKGKRISPLPCTACEYCMPCPYGINIPGIFQHYNKCVTEGTMATDRQDPGNFPLNRCRIQCLACCPSKYPERNISSIFKEEAIIFPFLLLISHKIWVQLIIIMKEIEVYSAPKCKMIDLQLENIVAASGEGINWANDGYENS